MRRFFSDTISNHAEGALCLYADHLAEIEKRDREIVELKKHQSVCECGGYSKDHTISDGHYPVDMVAPCPFAAKLSRLTAEIAELKADNEILRNMNKINNKCVLAMSAKLSRLTALVNDDEKVEKVIRRGATLDIRLTREAAVDDYRAMLKEEMGI